MRTLSFLLLGVMVVAQWTVPGSMIYESETVLSTGTVYKFRTRPVDPSDPFRGKYITLTFDADHFDDRDSVLSMQETGDVTFITFDSDSMGFAKPAHMFAEPPATGPYLQVNRVRYNVRGFDLPFDRFYVEESKASEAERASWEARRDRGQVEYALVRMGRGHAVLADVMINDSSIVEIVRRINKGKE